MRANRIVRTLCWVLLFALVLLVPSLVSQLPAVNDGLAATSYEGWAGVLRVWVCGGWTPGSGNFVPWLNSCASRFEKRHPGVYVQIQSVDESVMVAFMSGEINPPDAILFAPGMIASGDGLRVLDEPFGLREVLAATGQWRGELRAVPVAMGGTVWAINQSMIQSVPYDWSTLATPSKIKKQTRYLMQVPADASYLSWSGALNALCAPRQVSIASEQKPRAGQGIDLGLTIESEPTPTPEPVESETILCKLPALLPDDFRTVTSAFNAFTSGQAAAIPATQREIRRLQLLSDTGRAPNWTATGGGGAFTDQLLMMGVVDVERDNSAARQTLAREWLTWLLRDDSQAALTGIRALRVTQGDTLYAGQMGMDVLEQAYGGRFTAPNAFNGKWREQEKAEADRLVRESIQSD